MSPSRPGPANLLFRASTSVLAALIALPLCALPLAACRRGEKKDGATAASAPAEPSGEASEHGEHGDEQGEHGDEHGAASASASESAPHGAASASASASASGSASEVASGGGCGEKGQPKCPLQAWMSTNMQPPMARKDPAKLVAALRQSAKYAPPGYADWAKVANDGAAAVEKANDVTAGKNSCTDCHNKYKSKYKSEQRARPI